MEPCAPSYNRDCAFSFHGSGGFPKIFFEEVLDTKKENMEERKEEEQDEDEKEDGISRRREVGEKGAGGGRRGGGREREGCGNGKGAHRPRRGGKGWGWRATRVEGKAGRGGREKLEETGRRHQLGSPRGRLSVTQWLRAPTWEPPAAQISEAGRQLLSGQTRV